MSRKDKKEEEDPYLANLRKSILPQIVDATVLILRITDNCKFKPHGSGVFFRIAQEHFIITAAHGFKEQISKNTPLCVAIGRDPHSVPLLKCDFHGTEEEIRDLLIIKLTKDDVKKILLDKTPITLGHIDNDAGNEAGLFLTVGYPQEWFEIGECNFSLNTLAFLGASHSGKTDPISGMKYLKDHHGVFDFDTTKAIRTRDQLQVPLPGFDGMKGISGCGIWRVSKAGLTTTKPLEPEPFRLTAIQHRYHESKSYVHGTLINHAISRLIMAYPKLRPSLDILRPDN